MKDFIELKCQIFLYECPNCGEIFRVPVYPPGGGGYGEFLLRSSVANELAYLYAIGDSTFSEVSRIVRENKEVAKLSESQQSEIFQCIVGAAYDPDSRGGHYGIGTSPTCPSCGEVNVQNYREINPPQYETVVVPTVKSKNWDRMGREEREHFINQKISRIT